MLGEMFDLDQTSPNIAKHDVRSPSKVCKRSNISPNMMLGQMLGEIVCTGLNKTQDFVRPAIL